MRTPGVASEYLIGVLTSLMGPQAGWSTSVTMPLARTITQISHCNVERKEQPKLGRHTVLVVQGSLDVIDCGIRHAAAFEDVQPFFGRFLLGGSLNQAVNIGPVFHAVTVRDKSSVVLPLGESKAIAEHTKESIVAAAEKNVTVEGLITPVWYNRCYKGLLVCIDHRMHSLTFDLR